MKYKSFSILVIFLSLFISCSDSLVVQLEIKDSHPWEKESARAFWYSVVYQENNTLKTTTIPIGERTILVRAPSKGAVVFVAYPLGEGLPLGAALEATSSNKKVLLEANGGQLAEVLLYTAKKWPLCTRSINWSNIKREILNVDCKGLAVDWNRFAKDLVNGKLTESSFTKGATRDLVLEDIPSGRWVCEIDEIGFFTIYKNEEVFLKDLPEGEIRFLNLEKKMALNIFISEDKNEDPYYYIGPLDPILTIPTSEYYKLLN